MEHKCGKLRFMIKQDKLSQKPTPVSVWRAKIHHWTEWTAHCITTTLSQNLS